jgi:hypothetical protein
MSVDQTRQYELTLRADDSSLPRYGAAALCDTDSIWFSRRTITASLRGGPPFPSISVAPTMTSADGCC